MAFNIGLAQISHPSDGDVISKAREYAHLAAEVNARLLVFPESLMTRFESDRQSFLDEAQSLDGPFAHAMNSIAADCGLWLIYTMNEAGENGSLPFNTAIIVDSSGHTRGIYRKVHLFDSASVKESSRMSAGTALFHPITAPFCKLGMSICYDLRFPELARRQALEGCQLLVYPAAWVDGPNKDLQWRTLLRARAIENEIFVAGLSRPDEGYVGTSYVFGPDGSMLASTQDRSDQLLIAELDLEQLSAVRESLPSLAHRRTDLY